MKEEYTNDGENSGGKQEYKQAQIHSVLSPVLEDGVTILPQKMGVKNMRHVTRMKGDLKRKPVSWSDLGLTDGILTCENAKVNHAWRAFDEGAFEDEVASVVSTLTWRVVN